MREMKKRTVAASAALALVLSLGACGDDDPDNGGTGDTGVTSTTVADLTSTTAEEMTTTTAGG